MTSRALVPISLMPENEMVVASAGYKSELAEIRWDPDQDMYSPGNEPIGPNGRWVPVLVPNRKGLDRLQIAGGISTDVERTGTEKIEELVWRGWWGGTYTTPAGIQIDLYDEYEFDVRPGVGARWHERVFSEYSKLIANEVKAKYLDAAGVANAEKNVSEELREQFKEMAEARATRYCLQAAQYGRQRALTGARLRALRTYFNIGKYTREQVVSATFTIQRTRVDQDLLEAQLGPAGAKLLMFADMAKKMNLDSGTIESMSRLMLEQGTVLEGETVQKGPFERKANRTEIMKLLTAVRKVVQRDVSDREVGGAIDKLFGRDPYLGRQVDLHGTITEGECQIATTFYEKLAADMTDESLEGEERARRKKEYKQLARQCLAEKSLWEEGMKLEQMTLDQAAESTEEDESE